MKELFPGYYPLNQEQFKELWENCIFVFDTNILLNLYRYNESTRNDFINNILRKIEQRLWIPHQVALEFQENRLEVIESQETQIDTIKLRWSHHKAAFLGDIRKFYAIDPEGLIARLDEKLLEYLNTKNSLITEQLKLNEHDTVRDIVDEIFNGKIGEHPTSEELVDIYKNGEERYKIKYPPGFGDKNSKGKDKERDYLYKEMIFRREYGDLILWKELLKEVKSRNWKHIIFVTDDNKEDWWYERSGKTIGPRPELIQEMYEAGVSLFYMYNSNRFIEFAQEYLGTKISENSQQEIEEIAELNKELDIRPSYEEIEKAFSNWLISQYPYELLTLPPRQKFANSMVDILCNYNEAKIGYELKYMYGTYSLTKNLAEYFLYLERLICEKRMDLDLAYLVVITYKVPKSLLKMAFAARDIIQRSNLSDKLGFISGGLFSQEDETGNLRYIFRPFNIIDPKNGTMEYKTPINL